MDRLEDDLRRVLTDPRRTLPPDLVTLEGVHRGATRRRRVRTAGVALAAAAALVGGVALGATQLGGGDHASLPAAQSPTSTAAQSQAPTTPTPTTSQSSAATSGGVVPTGYLPTSFTAIGTSTWWVVGAPTCLAPRGCSTLLRTDDGGRTFTQVPLSASGASTGSAISSANQVRFASRKDGWLWSGSSVWSTHDGGRSWHRRSMPGVVVDLEAGAGVAWAVVENRAGTRSLLSTDVTIDGWSDRTPTWATPRTLAVDGAHVVVWASTTSSTVPHGGSAGLLSTTDAGRSWTLSATPTCTRELDAQVSASGGGVWLACPTGTAAAVYPAPLTNATATLDPSALGGGSLPNSVAVAPRDAGTAALGLGADGIAVVTSSGKVLHKADVGGAPTWIGFTTPDVGYALVATGSSPAARLLRTTDGGATWRAVSFG